MGTKESAMGQLVIYVGKSNRNRIINRIIIDHCRGSLKGSVLRSHVAEAGEENVTDYICSGTWKYVICNSASEAEAFKRYIIKELKPLLNKRRPPADPSKIERHLNLLGQLLECPSLDCNQLGDRPSGNGVCVFYHERPPGVQP